MSKGFSNKLKEYVFTYVAMTEKELDDVKGEELKESDLAVSIRTVLTTRMQDFEFHGSLRSDLPLTPLMAYIVAQHINQKPTPAGNGRCEDHHQQPKCTFPDGTSAKDMDAGTTQIC